MNVGVRHYIYLIQVRSGQVSNWVIHFLWYLARAARRKFYFCNLGARSVDLSYHWVSADLKNTKVEPCICTKHNARATKSLQKVFFGIFFCKNPNPKTTFFLYVKLLISLLNGALFRLGENFSVRGHGAK